MKCQEINVNPDVLKILKNNNWSPDRNIDISSILDYLKEKHFPPITKEQARFLKNFANMEICFENINSSNSYSIRFFKEDYLASKYWLEKYENYTGEQLLPIGFIEYDDIFLLMDNTLKIYGAFECDIAFLGENIFEVLEILYQDKKIIWNRIHD